MRFQGWHWVRASYLDKGVLLMHDLAYNALQDRRQRPCHVHGSKQAESNLGKKRDDLGSGPGKQRKTKGLQYRCEVRVKNMTLLLH